MVELLQSGKRRRGRARIIALAVALGTSGLASAPAASADAEDYPEPEALQYLLNLADDHVPVVFSNQGPMGQRLAINDNVPHDGNEVEGVSARVSSNWTTLTWVLDRTRNSKDGYFVIRNLRPADNGRFLCLQPEHAQDPTPNAHVRVRYCSEYASRAESWYLDVENFTKRKKVFTLRPGAGSHYLAVSEAPQNDRSWVLTNSSNSFGSGGEWQLIED